MLFKVGEGRLKSLLEQWDSDAPVERQVLA